MLLIKGIYLLLSHLPTSHTTVRAVRHTAVSCFYTLRCVASCFQPSLRDTSLLFYCRIPSYRVNREFLFGHLTTKDSQGSSHLLLHCTIQSFPIGTRTFGTMTSADFSRQALLRHGTSNTSTSPCVRETPRIRALSFHLIPTSFFRKLKETPSTVPNSYRALVYFATLPTVICLV